MNYARKSDGRTARALVKVVATTLGLLIFLEGLYMTSFFAFYLFSMYTPLQSLFERFAITQWMTDFYLSHFIDWSPAASAVQPGLHPRMFNPFHLNIYRN